MTRAGHDSAAVAPAGRAGEATPRSSGAVTILKLGGELLEERDRLGRIAGVIVRLATHGALVIVHGGGRDIDAALARHGLTKRTVDGLRITDDATLDVVISVLAGNVNTRLVAAVMTAGGRAVGLTGADDRVGLVAPAAPHKAADGRLVDLERVGTPIGDGPPALLVDLCARGYVPVLASIGVGEDGRLYNVNADTFAAHLAVRLGAARLMVAGATAGVLDRDGQTIPRLSPDAIRRMVAGGDAHAGMVAKLAACEAALRGGVAEVVILDGREPSNYDTRTGTLVTP